MEGKLTIKENEVKDLVKKYLQENVFPVVVGNSITVQSIEMETYRNDIKVSFTNEPKEREAQDADQTKDPESEEF